MQTKFNLFSNLFIIILLLAVGACGKQGTGSDH